MLRKSSIVLFLYYIGRLLTFVSTAYVLPKVLGMDLLGLYSAIQALGFVMSRFDVASGIIRFFPQLHGKKNKKATFFTCILLVSSLFYLLLWLLFLYSKNTFYHLLSARTSELADYLPISLVLGYLITLNITLKACCIAMQHTAFPNALQHVSLPLLTNLMVLCYHVKLFSFDQMLIALLLPYALNIGLLLVYLISVEGMRLGWDWHCLDDGFLKSFMVYNFFMLISTSFIFVLTRIDTIMLLSMCGKQEAGIYRTIAFIVLLVNAPQKAFSQVNFSKIAIMLAQKRYDVLSVLGKKVTLYQFSLSCLVAMLLYANLPYLFAGLPTHTRKLSKLVFIVLTCGELMYVLCDVSHSILIFSRYFKLNIINVLLIVVAVVANYGMIGRWGMLGAAWATLLALTLNGVSNCMLVWYKLALHPFSKILVLIIFMTALNLSVQTYLNSTLLRIFSIIATHSPLLWYYAKVESAT